QPARTQADTAFQREIRDLEDLVVSAVVSAGDHDTILQREHQQDGSMLCHTGPLGSAESSLPRTRFAQRNTLRPSNHVSRTVVSISSLVGDSNGSRSSTTKSADFPAVNEPVTSPSPMATAPLRVNTATDSANGRAWSSHSVPGP